MSVLTIHGHDRSVTHVPVSGCFLDGVPAGPCDGAEAAGGGCPGTAAGFEVAAKVLDVRAAGLEQAQVVLLAPSWRTGAGPARRPDGSGRCRRRGIQLMPAVRCCRTRAFSGRRQRTESWRSSGTSGAGLRPGGWASPGPANNEDPHGKTAATVTPGHAPAPARTHPLPDDRSRAPNRWALYCRAGGGRPSTKQLIYRAGGAPAGDHPWWSAAAQPGWRARCAGWP